MRYWSAAIGLLRLSVCVAFYSGFEQMLYKSVTDDWNAKVHAFNHYMLWPLLQVVDPQEGRPMPFAWTKSSWESPPFRRDLEQSLFAWAAAAPMTQTKNKHKLINGRLIPWVTVPMGSFLNVGEAHWAFRSPNRAVRNKGVGDVVCNRWHNHALLLWRSIYATWRFVSELTWVHLQRVAYRCCMWHHLLLPS